jgi:hypothetical protein
MQNALFLPKLHDPYTFEILAEALFQVLSMSEVITLPVLQLDIF